MKANIIKLIILVVLLIPSVSAIGYKTVEKQVKLIVGERVKQNLMITPETQQLDEVTIVSTGVTPTEKISLQCSGC